MSVRAKFYVEQVTRHGNATGGGSPGGTVVLKAVNGTEADNATWSKYTPSGRLEMFITNPPALDQFEPGTAFYLEFTPA